MVRGIREQLSGLKRDLSDHQDSLDLATQKIVDAIIQQQDAFLATHHKQATMMRTMNEEKKPKIEIYNEYIANYYKLHRHDSTSPDQTTRALERNYSFVVGDNNRTTQDGSG